MRACEHWRGGGGRGGWADGQAGGSVLSTVPGRRRSEGGWDGPTHAATATTQTDVTGVNT